MPEAEVAVPAPLMSGGGATGSAVPGTFPATPKALATVLMSGGGAIGCAAPIAALLSCVPVAFFKSGAGAIGSGVFGPTRVWLAAAGSFGSGFTAAGTGAILSFAKSRAPLVTTGGAMADGCGNTGECSCAVAFVTSGGGATGVKSSKGATNLGVFVATAATGGACGTGLESTMSGTGVLARIFGASGATMVWVELSDHFGIAIASTKRWRGSARDATAAREL